jgi:hypothetical protein
MSHGATTGGCPPPSMGLLLFLSPGDSPMKETNGHSRLFLALTVPAPAARAISFLAEARTSSPRLVEAEH